MPDEPMIPADETGDPRGEAVPLEPDLDEDEVTVDDVEVEELDSPLEAALPPLPPSRSIANSRRYLTCPSGQCLAMVSRWLGGPFGAPHMGYAREAWDHSRLKHPGDDRPPAGVPVYWDHGTANKWGHVALSLGGGRIRTTGWGAATDVGETSIDALSRAWRRQYLGWAGDFAQKTIPGVAQRKPGARAFPGAVRQGSRGAVVVTVQQRLRQLGYTIAADGVFGPKTEAAVRDYQRKCQLARDGICGPRTWAALWR